MGTMFITALGLGGATAFLELRFGFGTKLLRALIIKSSLFGMLFSLFLSLAIGTLFAASGVTVMLIAMVCMTFTQPVYMIYNKIRSTGREVSDVINDIKQAVAPFVWLFKLAFKLIALPIKMIYIPLRWAMQRSQPAMAAS